LRKCRFSYIDTSPALSARRHLTAALRYSARPPHTHTHTHTHNSGLLGRIQAVKLIRHTTSRIFRAAPAVGRLLPAPGSKL
jgi:hypothetical protein